jgi:hypothetical protein
VQEAVTAAVVQNAWHRLLPALVEEYDSPMSLPCIAPRPLLVVNGEKDPRCPIAGLDDVFARCRRAYSMLGAPEDFIVHIEPDTGHAVTHHMDCVVEHFFYKHLRPAGKLAYCPTLSERGSTGPQWWPFRRKEPVSLERDINRRPSHLFYEAWSCSLSLDDSQSRAL